MSKELKALIKIEDLLDRLDEFDVINNCYTPDISIIANALKHHEHNMSTIIPNLVKTNEEQARVIEEQKKELKALEIIKEKKVDVYGLCLVKNLEEYNKRFSSNIYLEQTEYDLLKEVLL